VHDKDRKCDLHFSSVFLRPSSVNEFSISVHDMDRFLTCNQCAKEVEVEGHVEKNFETPMMKHNTV